MLDSLLGRLSRASVSPRPGSAQLCETLRAIDEACRSQIRTGAFLSALDESKRVVYRCLREHFDSPLPAKALTLKVLNLCLAKYHFMRRSTAVFSRPLGLVVDPSNACGLACPGCVHSVQAEARGLFHWDRSILSSARAESFLERYGPYAIRAEFCNYGEPLLNPETPRFIRVAKSYWLGTLLSTSLSIPRFDADAYVESGLDDFEVSIDGATQPVYERFRRRGKLELVFSNVRKLVEARQRLGKRTPVISWRYLVFEHNAHETAFAAGLARELGVDRFILVPPFDVTWDDPGIRPSLRREMSLEVTPDTERRIAENWRPYSDPRAAAAIERAFEARWGGRFARFSRGEEQPARRSDHTCHWLYRSMVMDAGGRILPCCAAPRPDAFLTFALFDGNGKGDPFNSNHYCGARLFFSNTDAYKSARAPGSNGAEPHCVECEWNQRKTSADRAEVRRYLEAATGELLNCEAMNLLAEW